MSILSTLNRAALDAAFPLPEERFPKRQDDAVALLVDLNVLLDLGHHTQIPCPMWSKPVDGVSQALAEARSLISPEEAKAVRLVAMSLYLGKPLCLVGPQGCGKSTLLKAILGVTNWDVVITQAAETTEYIDLMGIRLSDGSWIDCGPLDAYRNGKVWLVEERDRFNAGTATDLNTILDRSPVHVPFLDGAAHPHHSFRVLGTANTVGNGDGMETHISAQIQTPAANRRWMFMHLDYMSAAAELELFKKISGDDQAIGEVMVEFARSTRGSAMVPMSTAELMGVAEMLSISTPEMLPEILDAVYLSKLTSSQAAAANTLWATAGGAAMASAMGGVK